MTRITRFDEITTGLHGTCQTHNMHNPEKTHTQKGRVVEVCDDSFYMILDKDVTGNRARIEKDLFDFFNY